MGCDDSEGGYVAEYVNRPFNFWGYEIEPRVNDDVDRCYLRVATKQDVSDLIALLERVRERLPEK